MSQVCSLKLALFMAKQICFEAKTRGPTLDFIENSVKQNATNNLTLYFFSVFIALSVGVPRFARCVALKDPAADWWETFNSQSGSTKRMVLKCNTESKTEYTI